MKPYSIFVEIWPSIISVCRVGQGSHLPSLEKQLYAAKMIFATTNGSIYCLTPKCGLIFIILSEVQFSLLLINVITWYFSIIQKVVLKQNLNLNLYKALLLSEL